MLKKTKKQKKRIIITVAVLLLVIIIMQIIIIIGINYQLLDIKRRAILIVAYVLVIVVGLYVLRRQVILFGLENNFPKEKCSELVFEETSSQTIGHYSYSFFFNGDSRHDDILNRILEDMFFQRSIPFYSKELVNIIWELKGNCDIIIRNGNNMKNIDDIFSLYNAYKAIMTKLNRKKYHILYFQDGIVERALCIRGKTIIINSNKREYDELERIIRYYL